MLKLSDQEALSIRFEAIMGIAGILAITGSLAPWEAINSVTGNALRMWQGNLVFIGGILIIFAVVISYRVLRIEEIEKFTPIIDSSIGIIGAILILIGVIAFPSNTSPGASITWGLYLSGIAGIMALFSAIMIYRDGTHSVPKRLGKDR